MLSPSQIEYQRLMSENLNGDALSHRIMSYKDKAPTAPEGKRYDLDYSLYQFDNIYNGI